MQLASELEARAIRLCNQATSRIIMAFTGTDAGGFVKFIVDSFGSTMEFTEAEAAATLSLPTAPSDNENAKEEEEVLQSPGSSDTPALADFYSVKEAKPVYPVSSTLLSATGVPPEFISENMPSGPQRQSTYYCLFRECNNSSTQKATLTTHIHCKHLGVSVACKFCGHQWWSSHTFEGHMEKSHPEMTKPASGLFQTPPRKRSKRLPQQRSP